MARAAVEKRYRTDAKPFERVQRSERASPQSTSFMNKV
jgi:hypothetical protein